MKIFLIILIVAMIIVGPLALLWSLNTLFGLGLDYGFWNWLAMVVLAGTFKPNVTVNK